MVNHKLVS